MTRAWARERHRDVYYRAAQREGLRSRAAYKLIQLQDREKIIPEGVRVLDLGASPGGWSLVAKMLAGPEGHVTAVDLRNFEPVEGVTFLRGRVGSPELLERLTGQKFDVVISDMSPSISGNYSTDHARSVDLVRNALSLATSVLAYRGTFLAKLFDGDMTGMLRKEAQGLFRTVSVTKPTASRTRSSEVYLVGKGFTYR